MQLKQLSVFVENRSGRVTEVTRLLGVHSINIYAISLADTHDFGIVRLIVSNVEQALDILRANQFTVHCSPVLAVEIDDQPGELSKLLGLVSEEGFNLGYLYGFVDRSGDKALLVFRFENMELAAQIIQDNGYRIVNEEEFETKPSL
ncbi:MAG: amino acid-binding protein [Candidatus Hinthialibacter antarcticus]|nr:amino acid-binding protein [Candidatus Hinthialibacter antarcticus]